MGLGCGQTGGSASKSVSAALLFEQRQLLQLQQLTVPVEVEHSGEQPEGCTSGKQRSWEAPEWMEEEVVGRKQKQMISEVERDREKQSLDKCARKCDGRSVKEG